MPATYLRVEAVYRCMKYDLDGEIINAIEKVVLAAWIKEQSA
jgi:hypothetical protein